MHAESVLELLKALEDAHLKYLVPPPLLAALAEL